VVLAAANPYKFKSAGEQEKSGARYMGAQKVKKNSLIYHVEKSPDAIATFIQDFGQLREDDEKVIVEKMVDNMSAATRTRLQ